MSSPAHIRRRSALAGPQRSDLELPPYCPANAPQPSANRDRVEHVFQIGNKPWATLKLLSSANSPKQLPTFFQHERILGSLELSLDKGDSIQALNLSVKGRIITGAGTNEAYTFLDFSQTLWSKSMGKPRTPSPPPESSQNGKLQGNYVWPISIELPSTVALPNGSGGGNQIYSLPHTFVERQTRASVQYNLTVHIARAKLRSDSQISTAFAYIPSIKPAPFSLLRQIAYQENTLLPGPEADPEGWKTSHAVATRGALFTTRYLVAKVKLSLAKPLCYTRGAAIPCMLDIECDNRQGLNVLSSTTAAVVQLQRRVRYYLAATSASNKQDVGWKEVVEVVNSAVWWPSVEGGRTSDWNSRRLDGEIRLPKDLKPSSSVAHFSISYAVVLRPFEAEQFKSTESEPLLFEPVEIATKHARGPKPKPFSPPGYDASTRRTFDYSGICDAKPFDINAC